MLLENQINSNPTLVEETSPIVMDRLEFEKKRCVSLLGFFRQPRILRILEQKTNSTFENWVVDQKRKERGWDGPWKRIHFSSLTEILLWISMNCVKILIIQSSPGYQNSNERLKLIGLELNLPQKAWIFRLQTCWKIHFYRNGKIRFSIITKRLSFWIFLDYQDKDAWSKFYYI